MSKFVVIDLDETLIYCPEAIHRVPPNIFYHLKRHHVFIDGDFYLIFERPFLAQFLQSLKGKKIGIWTAADKSYADFIVSNILEPYLLPEQKFEFVWHRDHCNASRKKYNVLKHLTYLEENYPHFRRAQTIIVDDNEELLQQDNKVCVVKAFNASNLDDAELLKVLKVV